MNRNFWPYFFIALFCLLGAYIRSKILTGFPGYMYMVFFMLQFSIMLGLWELITWVHRVADRRFSLEKRPFLRIMLPVVVSTLSISSIFLLSLGLFSRYLPTFVSHEFLILLGTLSVVLITLLNFIFFTVDFLKKLKVTQQEKIAYELRAIQAEREKTLMQYHHLRNQVNPHFLFNTLTSLDGLVQQDPKLASQFIHHLAKVYRYVLEHKTNEVVSLQTELDFIQHYISLLNIRYGQALQIVVEVNDRAKDQGIVMVTLQMLIDNALKHNIVEAAQPLHIHILSQEAYLEVQNNKQIRKQIEVSTGQGLAQLQHLYHFLSEKPVKVLEDEQFFTIQIPLL